MSSACHVALMAAPRPGSRQADALRPSTPLGDGGEPHRYRIPFAQVAQDLNAFWQCAFAALNVTYRAPAVHTLTRPVVTGCGPAGPESLAFYCPAEEAVYYVPRG